MMVSCLVSVLHSPRLGRWTLALALFYISIVKIVKFAYGVHSYFDNDSDCVDCELPRETLSSVQKVLVNPTAFTYYIGLFYCVMFKQHRTFPVLFVCLFINHVIFNFIIGWSVAFQLYNPIVGPAAWAVLFVTLFFLRYIGNKRALSIYESNSKTIEEAYMTLYTNEKSENSQFWRLCASFPPPEPRQQSSEQAPNSIEMQTRSQPVVVIEAEPNQCSPSNLSDNEQNLSALFVAQTNTAGQNADVSTNSANFQKIESIFKTERTLQGEVLQSQRSFEKLIEDAEFINDAFQEWVRSWLSGGPDLDAVQNYIYQVSPQHTTSKSSFKNLSEKISAPIKGVRIRGPLKHVDRAIAKVNLFLKHFHPWNSIFLNMQRFIHELIVLKLYSGSPRLSFTFHRHTGHISVISGG